MLLTSMTADELDRLATIEPDRLDIARALSAVLRNELDHAESLIAHLEGELVGWENGENG